MPWDKEMETEHATCPGTWESGLVQFRIPCAEKAGR